MSPPNNIGERDLDPFAKSGGGMFFGEEDMNVGDDEDESELSNQFPEGARYDPITPFEDPRNPRNHPTGDPDNDELFPPN